MRQAKVAHYLRGRSLGAAVVVAITTAVLNSSCFFDTRTTLCEASGLRCSPGQACAMNQDICVDIGGCGDVITTGDEVCDDGNRLNGDGCSANCKSDETCGNGTTDMATGETCDDGNTLSGDSCSPDCVLAACGNRTTDVNEECDTGREDSQSCDGDCTFVKCGDSRTNNMAGEECDDGLSPSSTCNSPVVCKISKCGDGFFNSLAKEECDTGGDTQACNGDSNSNKVGNCAVPSCGDGYLNTKFKPPGQMAKLEQCDAGGDAQTCNGNNNDDSTNKGLGDCQTPSCGDGYFNSKFKPLGTMASPEQCDTKVNTSTCNGNDNDNNTHQGAGDCQFPRCGDGYFNPLFTPPGTMASAEQCDTGGNSATCNGNDNADAIHQDRGDCQKPSCGDGYTNPLFIPTSKFSAPRTIPGEECDNGPANSDNKVDACRTDCRKAFCGDGVKDMDEVCDKGDPLKGIPETGCGSKFCNTACSICN